eukprot:scaffold7102_cov247-Pinguiococcus_pyrenoidosus.AAC.6
MALGSFTRNDIAQPRKGSGTARHITSAHMRELTPLGRRVETSIHLSERIMCSSTQVTSVGTSAMRCKTDRVTTNCTNQRLLAALLRSDDQ